MQRKSDTQPTHNTQPLQSLWQTDINIISKYCRVNSKSCETPFVDQRRKCESEVHKDLEIPQKERH